MIAPVAADPAALPAVAARSNTGDAEYEGMVERAREYIRAGDAFPIVLSQRYEAEFPLPAFALYRSLRRINPAPFLCYLDFGDFQIVCSSPEITGARARWRGDRAPHRRHPSARCNAGGDRRHAEDLLADPKERAEHLMLLDLGRNDVGRVAQYGTVEVTDSFFLEYYSQVMHIVSNVTGRLDPRHDALEALVAGPFPRPALSRARQRCGRWRSSTSWRRRSAAPMAGCIGYFGADGQMDTCIVLRTAVVKDAKMYVQAGAGIVYDSDPVSERIECVNKSKALFKAAEDAVRFASRSRRGQ